jgi:hypothetical protein
MRVPYGICRRPYSCIHSESTVHLVPGAAARQLSTRHLLRLGLPEVDHHQDDDDNDESDNQHDRGDRTGPCTEVARLQVRPDDQDRQRRQEEDTHQVTTCRHVAPPFYSPSMGSWVSPHPCRKRFQVKLWTDYVKGPGVFCIECVKKAGSLRPAISYAGTSISSYHK